MKENIKRILCEADFDNPLVELIPDHTSPRLEQVHRKAIRDFDVAIDTQI